LAVNLFNFEAASDDSAANLPWRRSDAPKMAKSTPHLAIASLNAYFRCSNLATNFYLRSGAHDLPFNFEKIAARYSPRG